MQSTLKIISTNINDTKKNLFAPNSNVKFELLVVKKLYKSHGNVSYNNTTMVFGQKLIGVMPNRTTKKRPSFKTKQHVTNAGTRNCKY